MTLSEWICNVKEHEAWWLAGDAYIYVFRVRSTLRPDMHGVYVFVATYKIITLNDVFSSRMLR